MNYNDKYLKYKMKYLQLLRENKHILDKIDYSHKIQQNGGSKDIKNKRFIAFTAKWCGHCQRFASEWKQIEKTKMKNVSFINYDSEIHKDQIDAFEVKGFPTFLLDTGNNMIEYTGNRSKEDIIEFIKNN